jgi:hypothetical protein
LEKFCLYPHPNPNNDLDFDSTTFDLSVTVDSIPGYNDDACIKCDTTTTGDLYASLAGKAYKKTGGMTLSGGTSAKATESGVSIL